MEHSCVQIQLSPKALPSTPCWLRVVAAFARMLTHAGIGTYDLVDFVAIVVGYAMSGEATLKSFYERLAPFAHAFEFDLLATA